MTYSKYFALADDTELKNSEMVSEYAGIETVRMDGGQVPGCMFSQAGWLTGMLNASGFFKHNSDELLVFIGSDLEDPENLNAEIELWLENDRLVLTKTCIVFIPAGIAHGRMEVKKQKKPVLYYTCHLNNDTYEEISAEPTAEKGRYAENVIEKYAPVDGRLPTAPEGFLTLLLWIDGKKLPGAPYMESVWFKTANNTGPEKHTHDFDEFIGFIGSDPQSPAELGAQVEFFIGDEKISISKSCIVFIPRGVSHSPILVPRLERPIIHFSGGNGGDYDRKGSDKF